LGTAAVNYQYINEPYSICSVADFSASPLSFSTTGITPQLVFSVGANSAQTIDLVPEELVNNSGETITVAIKTSGQVSGEIGINWFEQQ
jgi:exonuclease I